MLIDGINASNAQWCGCSFISCYTLLKLALLLHNTVLITFLLGSTVMNNVSTPIVYNSTNLAWMIHGHWSMDSALAYFALIQTLFMLSVCIKQRKICTATGNDIFQQNLSYPESNTNRYLILKFS